MIRQARTYFVGAMSGASLIAVAIAVFVLLVSTQVFGDWPVAGLLGGDRPAVSDAREAAVASGGGNEAAAGKGEAEATGVGDRSGAARDCGGGGESSPAGVDAGVVQSDGNGGGGGAPG